MTTERRHRRHPVHQCGRSDEGVMDGLRVRHVQPSRTLGDSRIDRQNTTFKGGQNLGFQPYPEHRPLLRIASLGQQDADSKLVKGDHGDEQVRRVECFDPLGDMGSTLPSRTLRSSETTFVSRRNIRTGSPAWPVRCGVAARALRGRTWRAGPRCSGVRRRCADSPRC